ncbi:tyrosine-type recombinase/integrase [Streptomyces europaeiscabiei]|uniref:tyrosine-type recombinase/integrase n=1 Tax=Streptomyces europaeiscabiei TaxID=146819 RepID=UPI000765B267|nr:tyrosine-type recombinase/integrase [Streptomyces europaeiscabiei]MDX2760281.1 tyrosine-type recombinase/integrase [Streptomyces europaeiscabiei]MDX3666222.1 tyrosine-type recombinase/integrase [Streptomyces europaeiscabiei]MDX3845827.1 tyrosine-type recombinase/integrase [Streptomyces europaeiscabiei]
MAEGPGRHGGHQARHILATNLLKNGADLVHVKRYLGQISKEMVEPYVHLAHDDPRLNDALTAIWVTGPGAAEPGVLLSGGEPMSREEAEALSLDLKRAGIEYPASRAYAAGSYGWDAKARLVWLIAGLTRRPGTVPYR